MIKNTIFLICQVSALYSHNLFMPDFTKKFFITPKKQIQKRLREYITKEGRKSFVSDTVKRSTGIQTSFHRNSALYAAGGADGDHDSLSDGLDHR